MGVGSYFERHLVLPMPIYQVNNRISRKTRAPTLQWRRINQNQPNRKYTSKAQANLGKHFFGMRR